MYTVGNGKIASCIWGCAVVWAGMAGFVASLAITTQESHGSLFGPAALWVLAVSAGGLSVITGLTASRLGPLAIIDRSGHMWICPSGPYVAANSYSVELGADSKLIVQGTANPRYSMISVLINGRITHLGRECSSRKAFRDLLAILDSRGVLLDRRRSVDRGPNNVD